MGLGLVLLECILVIIITAIIVRVCYVSYLLRDIPSPPKLPIIGHALNFKDDKTILPDLIKIQYEYGGVVKLNALCFYLLLITDHQFVEYILNSSKILNKSYEYSYFRRWLGRGLLTCSPKKWRKTRKIITPTFHFQVLEQFIDVFHSASDILVEKLKEHVGKQSVDIYPYITLCALDVICETAMGTKVHAQEKSDSEYVQSVQEISRIIRRRMFSPVKMIPAIYYLSRDYRKEKKVLSIIHGYTNSVIRKRKEEKETSKDFIINGTKKKRLAFLDMLLESTIDGRPMTDIEVREEVDTFMFEGHDTTASAITFALYCLAKNLDVQRKVIEELKDIFGDDKYSVATSDNLQRMVYLEMVIKETLRLYPSVPFYARKVRRDTKYYGGILPSGITLGIFAYGLHRNPYIYKEPEKFDPERFTKKNQQKRSPFSYVPFSAGPRNCIGQKFAMLEMKATLAKVLRHFECLPVEGFEPILVPDTILKSINGVEVCLRERNF